MPTEEAASDWVDLLTRSSQTVTMLDAAASNSGGIGKADTLKGGGRVPALPASPIRTTSGTSSASSPSRPLPLSRQNTLELETAEMDDAAPEDLAPDYVPDVYAFNWGRRRSSLQAMGLENCV